MFEQYLDRYAAAEISIAETIETSYRHAVVIPVVDESASFIDDIAPGMRAGRCLCIIVVNATSRTAPAARQRNATLIGELRRRADAETKQSMGPPAWLCRYPGFDCLIIDRGTDATLLADGEGVGHARRIGCDLALALTANGHLASAWIHTTDADVLLPSGYFTAANDQPDPVVAVTHPFWHDTRDDRQGRALALYELSLRYYVLGLAWAGSPYAFHTVGSTLAFRGVAYAKARGMPRRQAGEDFYLLSKLAKLGAVARPDVEPIRIRQRDSHRVPFGTGPGMRKIVAALDEGEPFRVYPPVAFELLQRWLRAMSAFARGGAVDDELGDLDGTRARALTRAIDQLDARAALHGARADTRSEQAAVRRVDGWFDGFRTLKFIHAIRDAGFPMQSWTMAFRDAPFLAPIHDQVDDRSLPELRALLLDLERDRLSAPANRPGPARVPPPDPSG